MNLSHFTKRIVALTLVAANGVGLAAGCAVPTDATSPAPREDVATQSDAIVGDTPFAVIGGSVDVPGDRIVGNKCVAPRSIDQGGKRATLAMSLDVDRDTIKKSLQADASAKYGKVSGSAKFLSELEEDELSAAYVLAADVSYAKQIGNWDLSSQGEALRGKPLDFYDSCGDGFVSTLQSGGSLYTLVKVHFKSVTDKKSFEASVGVDAGVKEFKVGFKTGMEKIDKSAQVSVNAIQVGGDAEQLFTALKGADAKGCAGGNLDACLTYVDAVQNYASDGFAKQFAGSDAPITSGVVDYGTREWGSDLVPQLGSTNAGKLFDAYRKQQRDYWKLQYVSSLRAEPGRTQPMIDKQRKALDTERVVLEDNKRALAVAFDACWPKESGQCASLAQSALASLQPVDAKQNLVPWFDAIRDDGSAASADELIDVNRDGRPDYCRRISTPEGVKMVCQMGVGGGFSGDRYGLVSPTFTVAYQGTKDVPGMPKDQPSVWVDLAGRPAQCFARNLKDPSWDYAEAFCITSNGSNFDGMMSFSQGMGSGWMLQKWEGTPSWAGVDSYTKGREIVTKLRAMKAWPYDFPR